MRYKVVGPPGTGKTRRLLNEVHKYVENGTRHDQICLLYTSPSPRDGLLSRMPSSA